MNRLTDAGVLVENMLFATLDPTTRKLILPSGESVLLTDTVGFIRKLPHHLVKAFKSTLDEVRYADILVVVCDASDPEVGEQLKTTMEVIEDLGGSDKPTVFAYNKTDAPGAVTGSDSDDVIRISAKDGDGIDDLLRRIEEIIHMSKRKVDLLIPYTEQGIVSQLYNSYTVNSVDYTDDGIAVNVVLDSRGIGLYQDYIKES
jgi:GTP-binding protein HflX